MKFAVLGAGAIGGYFGASLSRAGHQVHLLARGEHGKAIEARGLRIRDRGGDWTVPVPVASVPEHLPAVDVALVAVKSYSLPEISAAAVRLAGEGAVVVPLLNGVEAFDALAKAGVPRESLLPGLAVISVERTAPGEITRRSDFQRVAVGEHAGGVSDRATRIARAFEDAGVEARASENIDLDLWRKFLFLASMAGACGLARASIGQVRAAPLGTLLLERAVFEIGRVGRARDVSLPEGEEDRVLERIAALPAGMKPSFLLDVERGGPTELDVLSGAVSRYGRASGVETPVHDAVTAALSAFLLPR